MIVRLVSLFFFSAFLISSSTLHATEITLFQPEGVVKNIKQVTVRFTEDISPLGDPRDTIHPFEVYCTGVKGEAKIPAGQSRWADSKNWVYDFETPIPSGVRCTFTLTGDAKDLKGEKIKGKSSYVFSTAGPAITKWYPQYGEIEPEQYFILELDGAIDHKSLAKGAWFEVQGLNEKIGLTIITGRDREDILENQYEHRRRNKNKKWKENEENILVISAARRFPEQAKVILHWSTGVLSSSGLAVTEPQDLSWDVMAPFKATFSCERNSKNNACNPISSFQLFFNAKVRAKDLKDVKLTDEKGQSWSPREFDKKINPNALKDEEEITQNLTFTGPFPEKKRYKIILPSKLRDDIGRPLANAKEYPLSIGTDEYSPLVKFSAGFGVLELKADPILPVSVRNIEKTINVKQESVEGKTLNISSMDQIKDVIRLYEQSMQKSEYPDEKKIDPRNLELLNSKKAKAFTLPKPSAEHDFEMMGIPLTAPGFYAVEIKSPRLGESLTASKRPMFVQATALVTNLGIHFKKGIESSLVWVTALDSSKPVDAVSVSIRACDGTELATGKTNSEGVVKFLKINEFTPKAKTHCYNSGGYYIFAKKADDFSFMSTSWNQGIESWRYQVRTESTYERADWGSFIGHTVLDRTLFKPGETVQMKHILREHHQNGFAYANPKVWPKQVLIRHAGSGKVYELPIKIDAKTVTAVNTFALSKEMPLGTYEIYLSNKTPKKKNKKAEVSEEDSDENGNGNSDSFDWRAKRTGEFTVSEFRLPLMAATVKIQGDTLIRTTAVKADLSASYMSGGPAVKLNVKTRSQLSPSYFMPDFSGADEYTFFSEPVKTGFVSSEEVEAKAEDIKTNNFVLDNKGGALLDVSGIEVSNRPKNLSVEMEYTDPNGEVKTTTGSKIIFPSKTIVGLRIDSWFGSSEATKVLGVVSTPESKLVKDAKFTIEAFRSETYTHRKRLVGGFYSYDSKTEIKSLGKVCEGATASDGRFECVVKNLPAGSITLQAKVQDDTKAESYASLNVNIFEKGEDNWWAPGDSDRIDVLAQKKMVEPNEAAKFVVKTPFKEATALVTIEREGILDQFVTTVTRDNPIISVPMKAHYAPNVFVSVMLVRGRVGEPKADFLVDLAKPSMKMGLAELKVGWSGHQLKMEVSTDKKKYNVRDTATVKIKVTTPNGAPLPKDTEVILAALDESLLHLKNNESFDLLSSMMELRGLGVETSSGLNQVIGRRHFGLKAKAPGGGGGMMEGAREHFDPLLAFMPKLKVNDQGYVETKIKLNDSITSFRIVAIAHAGADLFGTGKVNIITNKDLILYSGISPVARHGDKIDNVFTLRNSTEKLMKVQVTAEATGLAEALPVFPVMDINPSETKIITLPINIPSSLKELSYKVSARDTEGGAHDEILVKEKLSPAVPERVLQATLFQLADNNSIAIRQPSDAIAGSGGVKISASSSLVHGLTGVRSYMEEYPYTCLEQRISKAVTAENKKELKAIVQTLPNFIDEDGLLKFFDWPRGCGSAQLSHYVLDILDENKIDISDDTLQRLLNGLRNEIEGKTTCYRWWYDRSKDPFYDQEKILLYETLSRYGQFDLRSLDSLKLTPNLWSTEALVQYSRILNRETALPMRAEKLKEVQTILRARINFQGSVMTMQESLDHSGYWNLFSSPDQAAINVFDTLMSQEKMEDDTGRMARGLIARLRLGHWDTTMANAWGVTMMKKFSEKFEKVKVTGTTKVDAGENNFTFDWSKKEKGDKTMIKWPADSQSKESSLNFKHNGTGKPWMHLETSSAIPLKSPMNFGYTITKNISAVDQKVKGKWSVGDVVNVEVVVNANNDQPWVVLRDPLPSGASHLGTGLNGESAMLDQETPKAKNADPNSSGAWPSEYEEKSFSNFTSYAAYLSAGVYRTTYRYRLNSAGVFKLPPTRVEAMYAPEVFGEIPNDELTVVP
jgi:uncharacterized protein YfaS (alpha-2-macroglobulin family)